MSSTDFKLGTYVGVLENMRGKTALLQPAYGKHGKSEHTILAQFDELDGPYSHGWHLFSLGEFEVHDDYNQA